MNYHIQKFLKVDEYQKILCDIFYESTDAIAEKNYQLSIQKNSEILRSIQTVLKVRPWDCSPSDYDGILILGITLKSVQDFAELGELTKNNEWPNEPQKVEAIWSKLLDCKERILYVREYLVTKDYFEMVMSNIRKIESNFTEFFANPLYTSIELVYDPLCSVCSKDIRTCEHTRGKIYNGVLCRIVRKNGVMEMSNIVYQPEDYRCRIWPWNVDLSENTKDKINTTFKAAFFTDFSVDDFLRKKS